MPGMLFHMMVYARTSDEPIMAVLNDAIGITGCLQWQQTHDREVLRQLSDYLSNMDAEDIRRGMENHIKVDEAMHGPESPVYPCMVQVEEKLREEEALLTTGDNYSRMAELIVETGLDGIVREKNQELLDSFERSKKELDLKRVAGLISGFYRIEESKLLEGLEFLKKNDFRGIATMEGMSRAVLSTYKTAMRNLSEFVQPEFFKSWYDYMALCFQDPRRIRILNRIEGKIRPSLLEIYGISKNFDFRGS